MDLNDDWNIEPMPHQGRHPNEYHEWVIEQMNRIDDKAQGNKDDFLRMFENTKQTIRDNPDMLSKKWWRRNRYEILQSDV